MLRCLWKTRKDKRKNVPPAWASDHSDLLGGEITVGEIRGGVRVKESTFGDSPPTGSMRQHAKEETGRPPNDVFLFCDLWGEIK